MPICKDTKKLCKSLRQQGFETVEAKTNHVKVFKDGRMVCTLSSSPGQARSLKNSVSTLKKHGYRPKGA